MFFHKVPVHHVAIFCYMYGCKEDETARELLKIDLVKTWLEWARIELELDMRCWRLKSSNSKLDLENREILEHIIIKHYQKRKAQVQHIIYPKGANKWDNIRATQDQLGQD